MRRLTSSSRGCGSVLVLLYIHATGLMSAAIALTPFAHSYERDRASSAERVNNGLPRFGEEPDYFGHEWDGEHRVVGTQAGPTARRSAER